jgi:hypothetical protein
MALRSGKSKEITRKQQIKDLSTSALQNNIAARDARYDMIPVDVWMVGPVYFRASIAVDRDCQVFQPVRHMRRVGTLWPGIASPPCLTGTNLPFHRAPLYYDGYAAAWPSLAGSIVGLEDEQSGDRR